MFSLGNEYQLNFNTFYDFMKRSTFIITAA